MQEKQYCNGCGRELDFWDKQQDFTIHKKIQYGSVHDGATVDMHLCCLCFDTLLQACAVSPVVEEGAYA